MCVWADLRAEENLGNAAPGSDWIPRHSHATKFIATRILKDGGAGVSWYQKKCSASKGFLCDPVFLHSAFPFVFFLSAFMMFKVIYFVYIGNFARESVTSFLLCNGPEGLNFRSPVRRGARGRVHS